MKDMKRRPRSLTVLAALALCFAALPLPSLSASPPDGTVWVRMPAAAYRVADLSAVQAVDYGPFLWLELTAADFARLQTSGLPFQVYPEPFTLHLGGQSFDPRQGEPKLPDGWEGVSGDGPDLYLVQLIGPTRAEWLDGLRRSGLQIVQYLYPFTYIVWGQAEAVGRAAAADFVRWTGPFAPAYRVLPRWRNLPDEPVETSILLVRAADTDAAIRRLEALGGKNEGRAVLNAIFEVANFTLSGAHFQEAAHIPGVYSLQPEPTDGGLRGEMSDQINVGNYDANNQAFPGYLSWLAAAGVNGNGVIIANVDNGIQDIHPDLVNRIIPCTGQTCGGSTFSAHGTHTAGIMAADGSSGVVDPYGFLRGLGMAPGANLVEQVYSPYFQWPNGMLLLMTDSYNNGASLSGNSWGPSGSPQGYDNDTMQVDIGVRDADPNAPGNQPLSYILSIMNGNGGYQTQGTPDEAKNIFTIGSTKMQTSGGAQILQIDDLSSNTAHGPCLDGRNIPHLVAPGCYVDSTVTGSGHGLMCGTSMASPHVSGAVALFIEYYRNLSGVDPSPALVKAAFLPVAHDLAGHLDADGNVLGHPFDYKQGWGRMDTAAVVSPTVSVEYFDNPAVFDNTGEEWVQTLSAADPTQPVRLMLVWTDAYGHGLGGSTPAWNNDLDLAVEWEGNSYYGNNFDSNGWSQPGGNADYKNNTEGVFLGPTAAGAFTVHVIAANINSDGIPNQGDDTDQDFALACYNCVRGADFTLRAVPDAFDLCAPATVTSTLEVGQVLTYSQAVTLTVLNVPAGVTASIVPNIVTPPGQAELTLEVGSATPDGEYTLVVSGTAEVTNVHTAQVRLVVSSQPPDAPALLSPPDGATGQPYEDLTFTWGLLPQVRNYSLQVDTRPTFPAPAVDISGLPTGTYTLETPLQPATCYFWRAMGENACGAGQWADPFRFATVALGIAFQDDLESGTGNWSHAAAQGADHWQLSTAQSHSPSHAWFVPDDAVVTDSRLWNTTPVPVGPGSSLTFWHRYQFEGNGYDGAVLEISTNGGDTWTDLGPYITAGGYNGTISTGWGNPLGGRQAWVGDLTTWTEVTVDLSAFAGQNVQVRWRIGCDSLVGDVGWYLDDVQITAPLPPNPAPVVLDVTPDNGLPGVQTPVTITGQSFLPTPVVMLDSTPLLSVTHVSSTTLTAVVPVGLTPGTYDLTLYNGQDCQEARLPAAFTIGCPPNDPQASFVHDSPVELGRPIHFTSTVTGTEPFTWTWDFGDGQGSSADPNPVYTYTAYGQFTVTLTVENRCGQVVVSDRVEVLCFPPTGGISSTSPVTLGEAVYFTATLAGTGPLSYTWDFGGPGTGIGLDSLTPVYTYTQAGDFLVSLVVTGPCGPATLTETVTVREVERPYFLYLPLILK